LSDASAYLAIGEPRRPEDVVARYAGLVKRIAYHLLNRLPDSVQVEDLIQAGMIGLLEAERKYDVSQGASFETYAGIRVRGAMLDEIRRGDWTPRSVHRKAREVAEVIRTIENEKGRDAHDKEIAAAMGVSVAEYHQILQDTSGARVFSLEELTAAEEVGNHPDAAHEVPEDELHEQGFQKALAAAIHGLPERERLVIALYYDEELNLKEIGLVLGVSESRVSQIHSQAAARLRSRLRDWLPEAGVH
jgi:RNA polymerase sigma factor for flagellar operon FliA